MANNQMVNFNSQDVANMYRRNQLANALQERMNAPTPVHTYQGFQAPISPLTGISKALDMYTAKKYDDQQEDKYQAEKAAAEQKVLKENSRLEEGRENFVSNFNQPNYSETPMPDARSSSESGIPLDQPRADVYTATPKTDQEKLAFALSRIGDPNQLVSTTAKGYVDQINEDTKAKTAATLAASNTAYTKAINEQTRQDMLSGRKQAQENTDRTFGQNQFNANRTFEQTQEKIKTEEKKLNEKPLPTTAAQSILDNNASLYAVDKAISLNRGQTADGIKGDVNATGYKGFLPNVILQRVDPEGVSTRAQISDIGSLKIHDRSGGAVTVSETPRLMPFIPTANDDKDAVEKKLIKLKQEYESMIKGTTDFYRSSGYKIPDYKYPTPKITPAINEPTKLENAIYGTRENGQRVIKYPDGRIVDVN